MKRLPRKVWGYLLLCLAVVAVLGWASLPPKPPYSDEAVDFKAELLRAISESEQIEVVEHSWPFDFEHAEGEFMENPPNTEYRRVSLDANQRQELLHVFDTMADAPKNSFSVCPFDPHHRLDLQTRSGKRIAILVCFSCGDTEWYSAPADAPGEFHEVKKFRIPPEAFQGVLKRYIKELGFEATRDWHQLAKSGAGQIVTPVPSYRPILVRSLPEAPP
ncbi:hypothetical protein [Haloferula sp. BvORR071]|uniref:hypothetical protein n=1 Tax=Haloferula sp. BvORR071 TaxID=1396141 RepID=UPI0005551F9D|nr:hypothetical protein [Haloferula sp. BvORR071]